MLLPHHRRYRLMREQHGDQVTTLIEDRDTKKTYEVRSRHVIACDGAKSKVRETLNIDSQGESTCEIDNKRFCLTSAEHP